MSSSWCTLSDLGFSSGEWFEIDGCHLLGDVIINSQTNLSENEPGGCLEWCGTKRVALQNSSCFCINDTQILNRTRESSCFQNCSGKEEIFKCGGNSSDIVSLYTARSDKFAELGPSNISGCLTYGHTGQIGTSLEPDTCTEKHPFYCYSEIRYSTHECYIHADMNRQKDLVWSAGSVQVKSLQFLWPAQDITICSDPYLQEGRYWVAVYQWTKVLSTSTTTSTTTTTTSTPSTTLPTTTTTITTSTTSTSSTISSTSTISETSTTATARSTPSSTTSSSSTAVSSTTTAQNSSTTVLTSSSSISASTSTSTSTKSTSTTRLPTASNDSESTRHETAIFLIDPPNIGLGVGIGLLVGIVISITINYFRMRMKRSLKLKEQNMMSAFSNKTTSLTLQVIKHDAGKQKEQNIRAFSNETAYTSFSQLKGEEHDDTKHDDTKHDDTKHDDHTKHDDTKHDDHTKHDDTKHDDTKYDDTKHDDTKHDDTKHDDTKHGNTKL